MGVTLAELRLLGKTTRRSQVGYIGHRLLFIKVSFSVSRPHFPRNLHVAPSTSLRLLVSIVPHSRFTAPTPPPPPPPLLPF